MSKFYETNHDLQGLYRCLCGSFRWVDIPRNTNTVQTPVCHSLMSFTWNFIDRGTLAKVVVSRGDGSV